MKKLMLLAAIAVFGMSNMNAQGGFKLGANAGIPIGDYGDFSSFAVGLDVAYFGAISDNFLIGGATGFINSFGKDFESTFGGVTVEVEGADLSFIPIAAAARFMASESFYVGADLGYAVGASEGNDGGFYYRPRVGYNFGENFGANASYMGVSTDGVTWSAIGVGLEYSF